MTCGLLYLTYLLLPCTILLACFTVSGLLIYYIWVIRYKEEIEEIRKTEENPLIGQSVEARDPTVAYWLNKLNKHK